MRNRSYLALLGGLIACESPVHGLDGLELEGPVARVSSQLLVGHWMQTVLADSFTGEAWWSFSPSGELSVLERRHEARAEPVGAPTERRFDATTTLQGDLLTVTVQDNRGTSSNTFVGAVLEPTSFAPALPTMDWLPGWAELEPNGLVLLDTAMTSEDARTYRAQRGMTWTPNEGSVTRRSTELELELESALEAVMSGEACKASLVIRVATEEERAEHRFELECRLEALPDEAWWMLRIHEDEWWQNVTNQLANDDLSPDLRSMMGHAISSRLYFHPEAPRVLVTQSHEMRHGMKSRPDGG
jgi:hypothetical protein